MESTCFSESIYNLIPSDLKEPPQPPRYTSVFKEAIKNDMKKFKTSMKTMGPAKVEVPSPKDFLKKHSKEKTLPPKGKFQRIADRKPAVPLRTDHPVMGIQSGKNFINTNAADVIMGVAKKPKPIYVDKRTGDKHDLETSGLVPKYINKKDYGVTPEYICKRNEEVKKAQEEYDHYIQESLRKAAMKRLSDEEREGLLQGQRERENWHTKASATEIELQTLAPPNGHGLPCTCLTFVHLAEVDGMWRVEHGSLGFSGAEKELGGGTQGVPVPLSLHRLHTKEDSQAEAGRRNEAAGT